MLSIIVHSMLVQRLSAQLLKSICIPVLLYSLEVLPLSKSDTSTINRVTDRAVYKIFHCGNAEDIQCIRMYTVYTNLSKCVSGRLQKFLKNCVAFFVVRCNNH